MILIKINSDHTVSSESKSQSSYNCKNPLHDLYHLSLTAPATITSFLFFAHGRTACLSGSLYLVFSLLKHSSSELYPHLLFTHITFSVKPFQTIFFYGKLFINNHHQNLTSIEVATFVYFIQYYTPRIQKKRLSSSRLINNC